ncbi:MAG TPA: zinc-dependent metalloprotease [Acidimicrobiia bacterium]|nr:zinc-dependent metalloprotease [Acidimicrobiia bacterium]
MTSLAPIAPGRAGPDPVDWALATRVARRVAGRDPLSDSYLAESLYEDFAEVTTRAEALVADFTRLRAPGTATAKVLDRCDWVDANVASMRRLLGPLTERLGERMARSPIAPVGRSVAGTELGVLLGWFAQRVLGQYDLLVPEEGDAAAGDAVYYVGSNVLALEKRFAFRPHAFRLWVAIHEVTHRAQFCGVPWMRDHFLSLVSRAMEIVDTDPKVLVRSLGRAIEELRQGRNPLNDGGLVALLASPEHRSVLDEIQALMSVLEGHGNRVMNELGKVHVAGQDRMARVLRARRQSSGLSGVLYRVLGLDAKMRQYEVGERFVEAIEREAGPRALDLAWRGPEFLPTLDELDAPGTWLARVGRGEPAAAR